MKNIQKHTDSLPLKKDEEITKEEADVIVVIDALGLLPQGEPKKIDPRHIC